MYINNINFEFILNIYKVIITSFFISLIINILSPLLLLLY